MSDNPLSDKSRLKEHKTWILPLEVSVLVDDATKYDAQMEEFIKNLVNELRGFTKMADGGRGQLTITPRDCIKDTKKFNDFLDGVKASTALGGVDIAALIKQQVEEALKKK